VAKYDSLRDQLASRAAGIGELRMTFSEVEDFVGPLPPSARAHRGWWANDSKVQAQAWRAAGWHVRSVDFTAEQVVFPPGAVGGTRAAPSSPSTRHAGQHQLSPRGAE
jgi:hypothetical protein